MRRVVNRFLLGALLIGCYTPFCHAQTEEAQPAAVTKFHVTSITSVSKQIDAALRRDASVDYFETRMEDVIHGLAEQHGFGILIHPSAIEFGLDSEALVIMKSGNIPLASILQNILEPYDCTITIHNDVLKIVSNDLAPKMPEKRVYDCNGLLEQIQSGDRAANLRQLQNVLTETVDPPSWEVNGGTGSVAELGGQLVISQTLRNHLTVEQLLGTLDREMSDQ